MKTTEIVTMVQEKIAAGILKPGERLPTHRDMAWDLKCSVGTVTRAYGELERIGITYAHVGRGTFVASGETVDENGRRNPLWHFEQIQNQIFAPTDLSLNRFYHPDSGKAFTQGFQVLADRQPQPEYRDYIDTRGRAEDLSAAEKWLKPLIGHVETENIIVTQGAQSSLYLTMSALTKPGDTIATEAFGYPGIKAVAQDIGVKLQAIEMDDYGMLPEAFEAAAKRARVRLLVTVPTNHNPTGTTLPMERRREIIRIALEHNIPIVEDGVYAPFHDKCVSTFWEICPENSIFLTSFSKVFSPGIRVGYVVAPMRFMPKLVSSMTAINWMTSPITLDLINQQLKSGVVHKHRDDLIIEGGVRFSMAKEILGPWISATQIGQEQFLPHLWVRLPISISPSEFIEQARARGIALIGGDRFAMNRHLDDHYIRVCLMAVPEIKHLESALFILADLLSTSDVQPLIS
ncbi:hypothetical protein A9Q83_03325 [Alphaproteobacteria bacterium 46_93_T64]|nr:hypothetical protein A9Q83_03325 [Alphaproteobacteria bacterium 46_93_T64]